MLTSSNKWPMKCSITLLETVVSQPILFAVPYLSAITTSPYEQIQRTSNADSMKMDCADEMEIDLTGLDQRDISIWKMAAGLRDDSDACPSPITAILRLDLGEEFPFSSSERSARMRRF